MAKQRQKRKSSKKRLNPLERKRIEAGMKEATSKITALSSDQVAPVVSKLTCDDATERAWAAACVSNLVISDASTRKVLLSKGIVPLLIERLGDDQQEVRDEALGALRNLASVDHTVANEYYNRNIMQPLSTLLPQISQTIDDMIKGTPIQDDQDADRRRSIWDVYVQHVEDQLSIVQLALELLADICVQDDSEERLWLTLKVEDGYQDMDEVMEGQEEEDEQDEQDDEQAQEDPVTIEEVRSNPVLRAYMTEVFPQLIRLSGATPISYEQTSLVPHITHGFILTHQRALECLNNFLLAMNEIPSKYWFKEHRSDALKLLLDVYGPLEEVWVKI
ncbi:hypothetical protein RMATCC62417_12775 [Rhizopus microsporus]|nr:hypothetical protein RMATCC62417_12775 [Rhizopus microsporus]